MPIARDADHRQPVRKTRPGWLLAILMITASISFPTDKLSAAEPTDAQADIASDEPQIPELARWIGDALYKTWEPAFEEATRLQETGEQNRRYPPNLSAERRQYIDDRIVNMALALKYGEKPWQLAARSLINEHLTEEEIKRLEQALDNEAGRKFIAMLVDQGMRDNTRGDMLTLSRHFATALDASVTDTAREAYGLPDADQYFDLTRIKPCKQAASISIRIEEDGAGKAWELDTCLLGNPLQFGDNYQVRMLPSSNGRIVAQVETLTKDEDGNVVPEGIYEAWLEPNSTAELEPMYSGTKPIPMQLTLSALKKVDTSALEQPLSVCVQNLPNGDLLRRAATELGYEYLFGDEKLTTGRTTFCYDGLTLLMLTDLVLDGEETMFCEHTDHTVRLLKADAKPPVGATCRRVDTQPERKPTNQTETLDVDAKLQTTEAATAAPNNQASTNTKENEALSPMAHKLGAALAQYYSPYFDAKVRAEETGDKNRRYPPNLDAKTRAAIDDAIVQTAMDLQYGEKPWQSVAEWLISNHLNPDQIKQFEQAFERGADNGTIAELMQGEPLELARSLLFQKARHQALAFEVQSQAQAQAQLQRPDTKNYLGAINISLCKRTLPLTIRIEQGNYVSSGQTETCAQGQAEKLSPNYWLRVSTTSNGKIIVQVEILEPDAAGNAYLVGIHDNWLDLNAEADLEPVYADAKPTRMHVTVGDWKESKAPSLDTPLSICVPSMPGRDVLTLAAEALGRKLQVTGNTIATSEASICPEVTTFRVLAQLYAGFDNAQLCIHANEDLTLLSANEPPPKDSDCQVLRATLEPTKESKP